MASPLSQTHSALGILWFYPVALAPHPPPRSRKALISQGFPRACPRRLIMRLGKMLDDKGLADLSRTIDKQGISSTI